LKDFISKKKTAVPTGTSTVTAPNPSNTAAADQVIGGQAAVEVASASR